MGGPGPHRVKDRHLVGPAGRGRANQCSGYYRGGEYAGYAVDVADAAAGGAELFSKERLEIAGSRMARAHLDTDFQTFEMFGREVHLPHFQINTWLQGVKGSDRAFRIPLPPWF